jgi:hypothetical protein
LNGHGRRRSAATRRIAVVALVVGALFAASPHPATALSIDGARTEQGDGAVWKLQGARNAIYIVGSVHLLGEGDSALPRTVDDAYAAARRIVMELDLDDLDPQAAAAFTSSHGTWPGGSPGLRERLGERRWSRVDAACEQVRLPCESLDRLEPWAAALLLSVSDLMRQGIDPGLGVEEQIGARARADGKPIEGLETIEYQLGVFDGLAPDEQLRLLELAVDEIFEKEADFAALTAAWRRGDVDRLDRLLRREYRRFPSLYDALVYRRNAAWVPRVRELLESGDDCLVVVGTLHLVGPRGLIAMLDREGLAPRRLRVPAGPAG